MINDTHTSSEQYNTFSNIEELRSVNEDLTGILSFEESLRALDILHSIELRRNKIRMDLSSNFEFANQSSELDFLEENPILINILPSIANYIKSNLDENVKLELDLLYESPNWETLFINVYTSENWEKINMFLDIFLDNLYEHYPEIAQKLNLNILPNEF